MAYRFNLQTPNTTYAGAYNPRPTTTVPTSTGMDPVTLSLILQGAGMGLSALSGANSASTNAALSRDQLREQGRQFDASSRQRGAEQALAASQMDPLTQQRSRQRSALVAQLMSSAKPTTLEGNRFTGGTQIDPKMFEAIMSYFSPQANAAAENAFTANANTASANQYTAPTPQSVGYPGSAPTPPARPAPVAGTAVGRNPFYDGPTDARRPRQEY